MLKNQMKLLLDKVLELMLLHFGIYKSPHLKHLFYPLGNSNLQNGSSR